MIGGYQLIDFNGLNVTPALTDVMELKIDGIYDKFSQSDNKFIILGNLTFDIFIINPFSINILKDTIVDRYVAIGSIVHWGGITESNTIVYYIFEITPDDTVKIKLNMKEI